MNTKDYNQLVAFCKSSEVTLPLNDFSENDRLVLSTQLKAYIARNIWNDDGFFPVIHKIDDTFQQAIMQ